MRAAVVWRLVALCVLAWWGGVAMVSCATAQGLRAEPVACMDAQVARRLGGWWLGDAVQADGHRWRVVAFTCEGGHHAAVLHRRDALRGHVLVVVLEALARAEP